MLDIIRRENNSTNIYYLEFHYFSLLNNLHDKPEVSHR